MGRSAVFRPNGLTAQRHCRTYNVQGACKRDDSLRLNGMRKLVIRHGLTCNGGMECVSGALVLVRIPKVSTPRCQGDGSDQWPTEIVGESYCAGFENVQAAPQPCQVGGVPPPCLLPRAKQRCSPPPNQNAGACSPLSAQTPS